MNDETKQPDAIDRFTIEIRKMEALERSAEAQELIVGKLNIQNELLNKIAIALEKFNLEQYMARMRILANQYNFSKEFDKRLDKMFNDITPARYDEVYEEAMDTLDKEG